MRFWLGGGEWEGRQHLGGENVVGVRKDGCVGLCQGRFLVVDGEEELERICTQGKDIREIYVNWHGMTSGDYVRECSAVKSLVKTQCALQSADIASHPPRPDVGACRPG